MEGVPPFHRRVYEAAREIPPGDTLSYGAIANRIGSPGSARAVGQALGRNPFAIVVPCHRVVAANGKLGGFSANGGVTTKANLLALETHEPAARKKTVAATAKRSTTSSTTVARHQASHQNRWRGQSGKGKTASTTSPPKAN